MEQGVNMNKYNTILFDLDGTLTDPKEGITKCVQYALEKMNQPVPPADELLWYIGPPLRDSFAQSLQTENANLIEQAVHLYRERYAQKGIYECILFEGIKQLLTNLNNSGNKIVLATSKAEIYALQLLQHYQIDHLFTLIVGSNLDGTMCDKTEIIAHILGQLPDMNRNKVVMIGDRIFDITGAKNNNLDCIGVTYGYGSVEEITEANPTYIAKSVEQLGKILGVQ